MKYHLKEHVTDEMLEDVGFVITDNAYRGDFGFAFENCFEAIRNFDERYEVILQDREKPLIVYVYDKQEKMYLSEMFGDDIDVSSYVQDLIDLDYVEVRND